MGMPTGREFLKGRMPDHRGGRSKGAPKRRSRASGKALGAKEGTEVLCFVKKDNYWVYVSVGKMLTVMYPLNAVMDTGAGANLMHKRLLRVEWAILVQSQSTSRIADAS